MSWLIPQVQDLALRAGVDIAAVSVLMFGVFFRRYRDKELATSAAIFNLCVFAVLAMLTEAHISVKTGFGLFAILALFTLRSEPLTKSEITYFFGSISLAVICSIQDAPRSLMHAAVILVLLAAYFFDHPRLLHSMGSVKLSLDRIDTDALNDHAAMRERLSAQLGVRVLSYQIISLDYVNDTARANVYFRTH